jgi:hypothetical protein
MLKRILNFVLFAAVAVAQSNLTVDKVAAMAQAGLSEDIIMATVKKANQTWDLSADDLLKLKQAKVSDAVIRLMMTGQAHAPATQAPAAAPAAAAPSDYPGEIGVYAKKGDAWTEILPEVVNWKTGGVLKSLGTAGIVKGDVNGHIEGASSRNELKTPLDFLIVAPEGVAITEYQLLKLRTNQSSREFRTVTGGVLHVKGGATRDLVPFDGKKVAPRIFKVQLPDYVGRGEYGFLPPGAMGSANSAASLGKMYTFKVIE